MTVKDILAHADRISKRKVTAPQYVHSAFQTTLVNRRRMTAWFRATELDDEDDTVETARHEHFTSTLDAAYNTLFPDGPPVQPTTALAAGATKPVVSNTFDLLVDVPTDKPSNLSDAEIQAFLDELAESNLESRSAIKDDPLDELYDLYIYVLETDYVASVVKKYWSMAADGTMPIPLAAWLTTAGFSAIYRFCEVYQNVAGVSHEILLKQYLQKKSRLQIKTGSDLSEAETKRSGHVTMYKDFSAGMGLMRPLYALREFGGHLGHGKGVSEYMITIPKEKPTDYISSPRQEAIEQLAYQTQICMTISDPTMLDLPEDEAAAVLAAGKKQGERDNKMLAAIMRGIIQVFAMACAEQDHENDMKADLDKIAFANPLLVESVQNLRNEAPLPRTELVFGMQLLLETGKSFFWRGNQPNPTNIRLKAIQFANEVKQTVWRIVEKEGNAGFNRNVQPQTFYALQDLFKELEVFTRTPRFDLYYQMPWTAGMQMSETLHKALEFGVGLCRTRDIFGQMLHMYNLARQTAPSKTKSSPLMEQLCELLNDQVFLGERPKKNFHNILLRFMGGELETDSKMSHKGRKNREGKHRIGAPKSLMDGAQDNKRLQAADWSMFYDFRATIPSFHGSGGFWAKVFTERRAKTTTEKQRMGMEQKMHEVPFALTLDRVKDVVMSEFTGPLPVAKINFFKIYELAVDVLSDIAERYQTNMPIELRHFQELGLVQPAPADACAGSSYVTVIMEDVDMRMKHARPGDYGTLERHSGVELVGKVFNKCLSGKTIENFLWKHG